MEIYQSFNRMIAVDDNLYADILLIDISPTEAIAKLIAAIQNAKEAKNVTANEVVLIPHPYTIAQWIREYRNRLLSESDWTQLPDAPLKEEERQAWKDYRQALRDLPQTWGLSQVGVIPETNKVSIDLSVVKTKEDISKLPFPEKPK